ncbi:glycoside hydrolase family 38 N-terminal domain-containing protein [Symbiobacterium terraclitae]|uniref:glycoside hydrolase family 38 N-terminal domain-containing protein n=1 Tax=Symbiobacterium terraclitae TaxID=557451 RepID=UPI0035B54B5E
MSQGKRLWQIGPADLVDNYRRPDLTGSVVWDAAAPAGTRRWPLFHPSEADPDGGYRPYPYVIQFALPDEPQGAYLLRLCHLAIAPRLAHLEVAVNGVAGTVYLQPEPARSGEIRLHAGLHTTIYAEGVAEVVLPAELLRRGANQLVLTARDEGEVLRVDRPEAIKRLDRMANGAGFVYQGLELLQLPARPDGGVHRVSAVPTVLWRRNRAGELVERCWVVIELAGACPAGEVLLTLREGERVEEYRLQLPERPFGHIRLPFDLFDGQGEVQWRLEGPGWAREGRMRRKRKWRVYVAPHAHTDIGYTHRQWEVAERLCRNIDFALDRLAALPEGQTRFAYHLDSTWALEHYLQTRSPERIRQLVRAVSAGKIGVAGNYVDLLTHLAGLEDLIRNQAASDRMLRPLGIVARFNAVVDVASITGAAPTILAGSGIRYLVHANNQDRGPFRLNGNLHRRSPFWWEGAAGGRVLVWLSKMYCELRKVCGSPPVPDAAACGLEMWLAEYEREDYLPDAVLLYGQEADNTDLDPQPADFVQRWNETYAYPRLIACDVAEFFDEVAGRFGDRLPTVRGDGGAYWEDGALSSAAETIQVRQAQASLPAAERLEALAAIHTPGWAFPLDQFDEAWRQLLLYDEHTWGAFLSCTEPDAVLARDQWAVKEGFARGAADWARRLLHAAATRHSLNWNNDGREVVVYNPHSFAAGGAVQVEIEPDEVPVDPATGEAVPMRTVRRLATQALVELWIEPLPGLSYRRLVLQRRQAGEPEEAGRAETAVPAGEQSPAVERSVTVETGTTGFDEPVVLENDFYRVSVDTARGAIASWFDQALGRELVDAADPCGLGRLLYARGGEGTRLVSNQADLPDGDPEVLDRFRPTGCRIERHALGQALVLTGEVEAGELTLTVTLPHRARWVDLAYRYRKEARRAKEAVYVAFPTALAGAAVLSDGHLGWVDWHRDQLPGGCKEWLPLQTSILLSTEEAEIQICSPDIPLFTVGSVVRGRWPKEMDLTGGKVFSYVMNNYWHTNYKAEQGGEIAFRYRLTSGRTIPRDRAYRLGWTTRQGLYAQRMSFQDFRPVRAPYADPSGGRLAEVGPEQVVLTAFARARWAGGYVLRLQEIAGGARTAYVRIPGRRIARAWLTDLLERERAELAPGPDGSLAVPVPAWGLTTVRIELEETNEGGAEP